MTRGACAQTRADRASRRDGAWQASHHGWYIEFRDGLPQVRGRSSLASLISYAFSATLTAMASEILRISGRGG